jgi:type IX secretion system substrate protein
MRGLYFIMFLFLYEVPVVTGQPCFPYGITFTSQAQIDSFAINYPNCTEIANDLIINGNDITNLDGLNVLTSVGSDLYIGYDSIGNPMLEDISGLINISYIGFKLIIKNNPNLESLYGLDSVDLLNGECSIINNASLQDFNGLNQIQVIRGYFNVKNNPRIRNMSGLDKLRYVKFDFFIKDNDSLVSLNGLDEFIQITGSLAILNNNQLENLNGLEQLYLIKRSLVIHQNPNLNDISSLSKIEKLEVDLNIFNNQSLDSLVGLENLETVERFAQIADNNALVSLHGLNSLKKIGVSIEIRRNLKLRNLIGLDELKIIEGSLILDNSNMEGYQQLESLEGINNLEEIGANLIITNQPILEDISALLNLKTVGGTIKIRENLKLTSLFGLDNIEANSFSRIEINKNPLLTTCEVKSICLHIKSGGETYINFNSEGCDSETQIQDACYLVGQKEESQTQINIYPNPAVNEIFIKAYPNFEIEEVNIYNSIGHKVLHNKGFAVTIDVSYLNEGIYIIEIFEDKRIIRKNLIINE